MGLNGDASREDDLTMSPRIGCCLCRHRSLEISRLPSNSMPSTSRNNTINDTKMNKQKRSRSVGSSDNFIPTPSSLNSSISGNLTMPSRMQSRNGSSRRSGTPIMYSNSSGRLKPPPIEKNIECTLDELCHGCKKTVMITRDVLTDIGGVVQEEELLTINVQPGWKKGTKIKFEGKGNERPNYAYSEDIIFYISEKRHQLFKREGDDLELCVEIPLLKALTGCTISVPLLGGEHMDLTLDEIIYPGYQKIITDQGMPISTEPEKRGNLRITFLVEFPTHLTDNQRSDVFGILQNSC
ncbi:putative chaperone DnaJ [Medicago truncatula]|nr:dnaJ homolog subfamily B member 13 [Medicago truncatula]RHN69440.1 putative chaperone DnaJ [Medicago truncatula]